MMISATDLARAVGDAAFREAWLAGRAPSSQSYPPPGTPVVHGRVFHEIVENLVGWLCGARDSALGEALRDEGELFAQCYDRFAQSPLQALLVRGGAQVASAYHLKEALRHFCGQLARKRAALPAFRHWSDLFLSVESAPPPVDFRLGGRVIQVRGRWDAVRRHPACDYEVVDYKLSRGANLQQDLVQLAIYAELLRHQYPQARLVGTLEYYLPALHAQEVADDELRSIFSAMVAPILEALVVGGGGSDPLPAQIEAALAEFRLQVTVVGRVEAPQLVRYQLLPAGGTTVVALANRSQDLMVRLKWPLPPVLGAAAGGVVNLDLAKATPDPVPWSRWIQDPALEAGGPLAFPVGVGVENRLLVGDLADANQCHLLVAGQTGSGKSVFLQALVATLIRRNPPRRLRLTLIDPKLLTFAALGRAPHLLQPVVTNLAEASQCLEGAVKEMERRYALLKQAGMTSLHQWQARDPDAPPFLVVVVDEFADLVLVGGQEKKRFENLVARLAGKARAAGIHLILSTQRPDRQVVTGLIRANLPLKVALRVANGTNSQIVLDHPGAEVLLGKGDLLTNLGPTLQRGQALYITDPELLAVAG